MFANDYQCLVTKTMKEQEFNNALCNYSMGLAGESGELIDLLKKHVHHGHPLDSAKVEGELGDILWYLAALCETLNVELGDIMAINIAKLRARYPTGFSSEDSINRKDITSP